MQKLEVPNFKLWFYVLPFVFYLFCFAGCATTAPTYIAPSPPPAMPGIYHRVERGQTLWRISRMYNIDLGSLVTVNRIPDAARIEAGQLIFIPQRETKVYPSEKYSGEDFIWPVKGRLIAGFGQTYNDTVSKGLIIRTAENSSISAAGKGRVIFYDTAFRGFGKTIIIDHGNGFSTVYSGISNSLVKPGDTVEKGAVIAKSGYLHFEIRKGFTAQNPYFYLP